MNASRHPEHWEVAPLVDGVNTRVASDAFQSNMIDSGELFIEMHPHIQTATGVYL